VMHGVFFLFCIGAGIFGVLLWRYADIEDIHIFESILLRICAMVFWIFATVNLLRDLF
jgi:hypothetical protein